MEAALLSSDEFMAVTFGGNWYDGGNYIHSSLHASLPGDAHVDWAGDIPAAITKCNQAIFDLGGEDENNAEQEALIAPALAMRAFYHFIFMDTFGATPKLDHLIGENYYLQQSSFRICRHRSTLITAAIRTLESTALPTLISPA